MHSESDGHQGFSLMWAATPGRSLPARPLRCRTAVGVVVCLAALLVVSAVAGQVCVAAVVEGLDSGPLPDASAPLADLVVDAKALLRAHKTTIWSQEKAQYLLLEGDVAFSVGAYGFRGERAMVRIDIQIQPGRRIHHLAAYIDQVRPLKGGGAVMAKAPRLLVTVSTMGKVELKTDLMHRVDTAPDDPLVRTGADRIRRHREALAKPTLPVPSRPLFGPEVDQRRQARRHAIAQQQLASQARRFPAPEPPEVVEPLPVTEPPEVVASVPETEPLVVEEIEPAESVEPTPSAIQPTPAARIEPGEPPEPVVERLSPRESVLPTRGIVSLRFDRGVSEGNAIILIGHVQVICDDKEQGRQVSLTAERAVIFIRGGLLEAVTRRKLSAEDIEGVYLEDNVVVAAGQFTVRAPRMYFDLERNKAILLEAVMYAFDIRRKIPLYVRAEVMRQTAATSFEAEQALLTTSEFAEPHFAIASDRLTIERVSVGDSDPVEVFTASNNTLRAGTLPVFWWPYLAGEARKLPIRQVKVGHEDDNGVQVQTTWDLFVLAGQRAPEGVELLGRLDYRGDHGLATGVIADYEVANMFGRLDSYLVPADDGTDGIGDRRDIEQDDESRGFAHWQHRHYLRRGWELSLEGADVSDETFLEEFFRDEAYEAKEYETSLYLKKQKEDWALSLLARYDLIDFTPQLTTLQAPGYTVNKLPELGYYRVGTSLWEDQLTWFSENRISRMQLHYGDDSPSDRGFKPPQSLELFGIPSFVSFDDVASADGIPRDWRLRFDTRHEITVPLKASIFDVVPYAGGRITAYDDDFESFSGNDDQVRFWGTVGTRVHTQFSRSFGQVESAMLDLHRLRHIVEPSADLFATASTIDPVDLPVYDQEVEGINKGPGVRIGLRNTFQTQRGGPGRWRSVDWIVLDTDVVFRDDDDEVETELARFFSYRPDYSTGGDHFYTRLLWLVSDTLGVAGELNHDFDDDRVTQWRLGATLQHTPRLSTFVEYEELDIISSRLLSYGFSYQLTTKYRLAFRHQLDFSERESRNVNVSLERRLPGWRFRLVTSYDEIDDEATVGVVFVPEGLRDSLALGSGEGQR